ncbi:hypothetical protein [Stieleria marina]|uniref:hypothetical protein n=1 Tax=Stieleria marina TaxID=1930275 RepID=UPI003AF33A70
MNQCATQSAAKTSVQPIQPAASPAFAIMLLIAGLCSGCGIPLPGGSMVEPAILGSKVDEINQLQEENAELAKLIVYCHEFEINLQQSLLDKAPDEQSTSTFRFNPETRARGIRLTPSGEDHIKEIADFLSNSQQYDAHYYAVVERSETSKRWATRHHYPVHRNPELDAMRRLVVVTALESLGVENADELVVIAPAFPTGMNATEAASAFQQTQRTQGRNLGN